MLRVLLLSLGTVLIGAGPSAVLMRGDPWHSAMPTLIAGGFLILVAHIDRLASFKAGPLEAELREAVREAYATLDDLKKAARLNAKALLFQLSSSHFMGGSTFGQKQVMRDEIITQLRELGLSNQEIGEADKTWREAVRVVYFGLISHAAEGRTDPNRINSNSSAGQKEALRELNGEFDFYLRRTPTSKQISLILSKHGVSSPELEDLISDLEWFESTSELRDRDKFCNLADRR